MSEIKVSIIVPVYKVLENYLRKCIESCINQTLRDIEIILVDDGSPDNCGKICEEYAENDKRINVIHKKNGGLSSARNAGFLASSGKWIMFVDGDDWIDNNMCEVMYKEGVRKNVELVICNYLRDYGSRKVVYNSFLEKNKIYKNRECQYLQEQILNFNAYLSSVDAKLFKKDVLFTNNMLHNEKLKQGVEGIEFNIRLFGVLKNVLYIDEALYHYVYNDKSITSMYSEKNCLYIIKGFEEIKKVVNKSNNKKNLMYWLYNRLLYAIITSAISSYFHPLNKEKYKIKKEKYKKFLSNNLVNEALKLGEITNLSKQRKIILWMIKHNIFCLLPMLARLRYWQKHI